MPKSANAKILVKNRLLAALSNQEYQQMRLHLEEFNLSFGEVLYEPGQVIRHVYFPNKGIVSLLSMVEERAAIEVGMVGNEGMVGISLFLGASHSLHRALVQGAGTALRMTAQTFRKQIGHSGPLSTLLRKYTHSLLSQISQTAACNRFHKVDARLARWLLMTHDRLATDRFRLTQQFLADMLGVRREGVTAAAHAFRQAKLISYVRGQIIIHNRVGLETAACQCYKIVKLDVLAKSV